MSPRKPGHRAPTRGEWHDSLDDIDPDARPSRRPEPPPGSPQSRRRKRAVARRSVLPVAPEGGFYYWCDHCNYCNTLDEGQQARCANHERANETNRKARQRRPPTVAPSDGAHAIDDQQLRDVHAQTRELLSAARNYDRALHRGNSAAQKRLLDDAIRALRDTVAALPRPDQVN